MKQNLNFTILISEKCGILLTCASLSQYNQLWKILQIVKFCFLQVSSVNFPSTMTSFFCFYWRKASTQQDAATTMFILLDGTFKHPSHPFSEPLSRVNWFSHRNWQSLQLLKSDDKNLAGSRIKAFSGGPVISGGQMSLGGFAVVFFLILDDEQSSVRSSELSILIWNLALL